MTALRSNTFTENLSPRLSERCRMVVRLRVDRNLTQDQIATLLGITQPMVWKYLERARREHPTLPRLIGAGERVRVHDSQIA